MIPPAVPPAAVHAPALRGFALRGSTKPPAVSVAAVLDGRVRPGRRVRVSGLCLGYMGVEGAPAPAAGPPPRTRSDWLLGAAGRAVYVVGTYPAGCGPMAAGELRVTVVARVAVDTVVGLTGPGVPRRYLVRR